VLIGIAEGDDFDRRHLNEAPQIAGAIPAGADEADAAGLAIGDLQRLGAEGGKRGERGGRGGGVQKAAAIDVKRGAGEEIGDVHAVGSVVEVRRKACRERVGIIRDGAVEGNVW
jgi:hypothetical protein